MNRSVWFTVLYFGTVPVQKICWRDKTDRLHLVVFPQGGGFSTGKPTLVRLIANHAPECEERRQILWSLAWLRVTVSSIAIYVLVVYSKHGPEFKKRTVIASDRRSEPNCLDLLLVSDRRSDWYLKLRSTTRLHLLALLAKDLIITNSSSGN